MKKHTNEPRSENSFVLINQVVDLWNNEMLLILKQHNLSHAEFTILSSIYSFNRLKNKNASQVDICNYAGIKQMNASILLRKLQERKFISRKEHPVDTRAKTVHLTPLGEQKAIKILAELDTLNYHFFQLTKESEIVFVNKLQALRDNNRN
ncbi:MAG: MarR family winged helix-turn-helix transcriptional regulator [Bacteroidia bacterium]